MLSVRALRSKGKLPPRTASQSYNGRREERMLAAPARQFLLTVALLGLAACPAQMSVNSDGGGGDAATEVRDFAVAEAPLRDLAGPAADQTSPPKDLLFSSDMGAAFDSATAPPDLRSPDLTAVDLAGVTWRSQ